LCHGWRDSQEIQKKLDNKKRKEWRKNGNVCFIEKIKVVHTFDRLGQGCDVVEAQSGLTQAFKSISSPVGNINVQL
jgi:hypothetical protein